MKKVNISTIAFMLFAVLFTSCNSEKVQAQAEKDKYEAITYEYEEDVDLSDSEWKNLLNSEEYRILRKSGTDRPFTGDLWNNKKSGIYVCGGCGLVLFDSDTKFKSGTGWPSFYEPIDEKNVGEKVDNSAGMQRTEVICNRCKGHLGHVFPDGPEPTGLRYCINTAALDFVPETENE